MGPQRGKRELAPTPSCSVCPPSLTLDSWGAAARLAEQARSVSSCWPVVIRKSPFTSSLHTLPLHTPPPADTSHREPFVSPTQQQVCSRLALVKEKAPPLGKKELLIGITGQLGARAEPASSQVGGAVGVGWPSAVDGEGQGRKYSRQRQLRLGSGALFLSEGLPAVRSALTGGLRPPVTVLWCPR